MAYRMYGISSSRWSSSILPRTNSGIRSGLYIRLKGIGGAKGGCGPTNETNPKNGRESDFVISSIARSVSHHWHPVRREADCAVEGNTFRCVLPLVAPENRIPDAREPTMNHIRPLRARADGTSLHYARAFRNPHLHPRDTCGIFRFQTCGTRGSTSRERDTVRRNALRFPAAARRRGLPSRC